MTKTIDLSKSAHALLDTVPIEHVQIKDMLWQARMETNRLHSIPHQYRECERTGRLANFRRAALRSDSSQREDFQGIFFNDSDVYKWMQAAAYSLAAHPDPELDTLLENTVQLVGAAQCEDDYLNTYYMFDLEPERWTDLSIKHELYCGGHMIEAAVAHHRATGRDSFLRIARKWADLLVRRFGPDKKPGAAGHPEIELALIELYRETGEQTYRDLAAFFVEQRGRGVLNGSPYLQDHLPIREQTTMTGHAVRQLYLCAGVTDLYAETGDASLLTTLMQQWDDFTQTKLYITGGAGARHEGETFGDPYELPNDTAYAETCAAIASFLWNWRMFLLTGEARFADLMEMTLYNGLLSGQSLDGLEYFYVNPLENDGTYRRTTKHFDGCACCPPNIARTLAALPGYLYAVSEDAVYIALYAQSTALLHIGDRKVEISQETEYPWDGKITLHIKPAQPSTFTVYVRIPSWAQSGTVHINGEDAEIDTTPGTYLALDREWSAGDTIQLTFPMPVEKVWANPRVRTNTGKVALRRGPVVYCLEQTDIPDVSMNDLFIPLDASFDTVSKPDLLGGVVVLEGKGVTQPWGDTLYYPADHTQPPPGQPVQITAIPYHVWANREPGPMKVWIPVE